MSQDKDHNAYPSMQNANYPPMPPQGYPPTQGYPPNQGYGGYPPPQGYPAPGAYPPAPGYPPPQGYGPPGQGYGLSGPGYPPPGPGYQPGPPIVNQPTGQGDPNSGWMSIPQGPPNCPPGLEYLTMIDQLLVHQKVELLEAMVGFETKNKFSIKNSLGQKVYYAKEDSDCCTRNLCGALRPFDMQILDNFGNQVIHLSRPLACDSCCFPCCLQSIEVSAPPGTLVGTVEQEWSLCIPTFAIKNPSGETVLRIAGPFCTMRICGDVEFDLTSADGNTKVGKISKQWTGLVREMFTDADYFGITFPMDLDVRMKAVMLGACFLIDAMYFEQNSSRNN